MTTAVSVIVVEGVVSLYSSWTVSPGSTPRVEPPPTAPVSAVPSKTPGEVSVKVTVTAFIVSRLRTWTSSVPNARLRRSESSTRSVSASPTSTCISAMSTSPGTSNSAVKSPPKAIRLTDSVPPPRSPSLAVSSSSVTRIAAVVGLPHERGQAPSLSERVTTETNARPGDGEGVREVDLGAAIRPATNPGHAGLRFIVDRDPRPGEQVRVDPAAHGQVADRLRGGDATLGGLAALQREVGAGGGDIARRRGQKGSRDRARWRSRTR